MPEAKNGRARTPRQWKLLGGEIYCPSCKRSAYVLRAVALPVSAPIGASWKALRDELCELWSETTRCANWIVSELYARDIRRGAGDERLGPMPPVYLYPEARSVFPRLPAQVIAALIQDVRRRYRANRHNVLWTRSASLASYRYPVALMLPTQAWSIHEDAGCWSVSVRLTDARWRLRLRGGAPMHKQLARLPQLMTGQVERGPLSIYQSPGKDGALMVRIVAWVPKTTPQHAVTTMHVRTNDQSMLATGTDWRIDPGAVRGVLAADARRRVSLRANLHAARVAGGKTDGIERALNELSLRTGRRLADACRTYASHLAAHATARAARQVWYDDSVRPALDHFPWDLLRTRVAEKLDGLGIGFVHINCEQTMSAADAADGKDAA
jgi:hypothetical protein